MISSVTNQGKLRFMIYDAALKAVTFIMFLRRVLKDAGRRLFVIVDDQRVHRANTRIPAPKTHLAAVNRQRGCAAMLLSPASSSSCPVYGKRVGPRSYWDRFLPQGHTARNGGTE